MDLFDAANKQNIAEGPLAARMRPRTLDEYIGQDHIVGQGRLLRRAIAADQLTSAIFYGPPGTGKTTLARVIANHTKSIFVTLNAVLTGVQNIRDAIAKADEQRKLYNRRTILFVDEVHRWNKSQQDALLPWVENGTIILVGATTENPFFEVNKALVSRSRVFQLKALTKDDLFKAAQATLADKERGYGRWKVEFEKGALEHLVDTANGDARSLLNALELAVQTTPEKWAPTNEPCEPPEGSRIFISSETAEESIQRKVVLYDRDGDYHYDIISAFIKSLRGRDPDAAMYWMARMLSAGEDPHFIFRRMIISACEDTGLADPHAISIVQNCASAFDRIGLPEGRFMLTQAALYLATCPKSNSTLCFFDALKAVADEDAEVPNHLRDDSRDAEGFGHGKGYMYPHAYKDHWVAQQYLPDTLNGRVFYNPGNQGYEKSIQDDVLSRRELQIATTLEQNTQFAYIQTGLSHTAHAEQFAMVNIPGLQTGENLTFSPNDKKRDSTQKMWQHRTESQRSQTLLSIRNVTVELAQLVRHHRNLVMGADDGLLLWDVWRKTPEGFTAGLCRTERAMKILEQYASTLESIDRPTLALSIDDFHDIAFDRVFYRNPVTTAPSIEKFINEINSLKPFFAPQSSIIVTQQIPCNAQRLSQLLIDEKVTTKTESLLTDVLTAENAFYTNKDNPLFNWNHATLEKAFKKNLPTANLHSDYKTLSESRSIDHADIERWFNAEQSSYATFLQTTLGMDKLAEFRLLIEIYAQKKRAEWKSTIAFFMLTNK